MSNRSLFVCPCISRQKKKKIKYFVLIMHYDFIFSFYYHFRGLGGMFKGNQFTFVFFYTFPE